MRVSRRALMAGLPGAVLLPSEGATSSLPLLQIGSAGGTTVQNASSESFAIALANYRAAQRRIEKLEGTNPSDAELDRAIDDLELEGIRLASTQATGPDVARNLLGVALARRKSEHPDEWELRPTDPLGIEDRIDVALFRAALRALDGDREIEA